MARHRPRKRFGQHFLTDPGVIHGIVDAIRPAAGDRLVEIGPGLAAITAPLLSQVDELHVIELDRDIVATLTTRFATEIDTGKLVVHQADALQFDFSTLGDELRIVGNLPYNISTPLLFHLLDCRRHVADMHFMLQKEVVDRMAAGPGSKAYGRLGIMLGCFFAIEALFDVDRQAFDPPPDVTSAIVRLTPLPDDHYGLHNPATLSRLVATAFSQRRKTVRNALRQVADETLLQSVGIDPGLRPEAISIEQYVRLANALE